MGDYGRRYCAGRKPKADYSQAKTNENEEQNDYNDTREEWSEKEGTNKR